MGGPGPYLEQATSRQGVPLISALLQLQTPGSSVRATLERAKEAFSAIDMHSLSPGDAERIDLNDPQAKLDALSGPAEYGTVCAFVSHSHHDDGKAKWRALLEWSRRFQAQHGRSPTLWIDKGCIRQGAVQDHLLTLPMHVSGCKQVSTT